jgi:hypothetical protein
MLTLLRLPLSLPALRFGAISPVTGWGTKLEARSGHGAIAAEPPVPFWALVRLLARSVGSEFGFSIHK